MAHTPETRARAYAKMQDCRRQYLTQNGPCRHCGGADRLEVHHKDPALKISHRIWSWRKERREAELSKCEVLCSTCHDVAHRPPIVHGTVKGYDRKCRCALCRAAQVGRVYAWRRKKYGNISSVSRKSLSAGQRANSGLHGTWLRGKSRCPATNWPAGGRADDTCGLREIGPDPTRGKKCA
jgi:hypothetical protein